jgi:hypothetical protein
MKPMFAFFGGAGKVTLAVQVGEIKKCGTNKLGIYTQDSSSHSGKENLLLIYLLTSASNRVWYIF